MTHHKRVRFILSDASLDGRPATFACLAVKDGTKLAWNTFFDPEPFIEKWRDIIKEHSWKELPLQDLRSCRKQIPPE